MKYPLVSIIVATYNSSTTLERVLMSIRNQTYPSSRLEILVVDGGSTDKTRQIARSFECRIIHNPKTLPGWAKHIGFTMAHGKYVMFLDSDEIIEDHQSIARKIAVMQKNPTVHAVTGSGYKHPEDYLFLNRYINEFGDPFSFFYYRQSKDYRYFINQMKHLYDCVDETNDYIILDFLNIENLPLLEFGAMGGIVDRAYLKSQAPEMMDNPSLIPHFINVLVKHGSYVAIIKHDALVHYSSDTLRKYLSKITSRVVNNVFTSAREGFRGREEFGSQVLHYKKYLFLPYAFFMIGPIIDAMYLILSRRHLGYFIHVFLSLYTGFQIVYYTILKLIGFRMKIKSYGEYSPA